MFIMCLVTFSWKETGSLEKIRSFQQNYKPKWAVVEITDKCNFNCEWCYMGCRVTKVGKCMTKHTFSMILHILQNAGIIQVTLGGGEPLIHPNLIEFVSLVKQKNMIVHIISNGWFIDEPMAIKLGNAGADQVQMNIDSVNPEKHDAIRGIKGSHARTLKAFQYIKKAGITGVCQTVLTTRNIDEIKDIIILARNLGIERIRVWDMVPAGSGMDKKNLVPGNYIEILHELTEFVIKHGAKNIISYEPFFAPQKTGIPVYHVPCPAGNGLYLAIDIDGFVKYCSTHRKSLYNIMEQNDIFKTHYKKIAGIPKNCCVARMVDGKDIQQRALLQKYKQRGVNIL